MKPVISRYSPIRYRSGRAIGRRTEVHHVVSLGGTVYRHYGPLAISPLVAVVPSSDTVDFWSTVVPASS